MATEEPEEKVTPGKFVQQYQADFTRHIDELWKMLHEAESNGNYSKIILTQIYDEYLAMIETLYGSGSRAANYVLEPWNLLEKKKGKTIDLLGGGEDFKKLERGEFREFRIALAKVKNRIGMGATLPKEDADLPDARPIEDAYLVPEDWPNILRMMLERKRLD